MAMSRRWTSRALAVALLMLPSLAFGSDEVIPPEDDAPALLPPEPLELPPITLPGDHPLLERTVEVEVRLLIDEQGEVGSVELVSGAGEPFDSVVVEGVRRFRFKPATLDGVATAVIVPFTHTFLPQPDASEDTDPSLVSALEGLISERGTRRPLSGAAVIVRAGEREWVAMSEEDGTFRIAVPEGELEVRISAPGFRRFLQREQMSAHETVRVRYLVERDSYDPFQSVVTEKRERTEVSRTTLQGREITRVPGTFGDPFRVIGVLPGVTQAMSLLPMPVVRGSSPGNTGFFLDTVRMPMLFHLFGGPAVVHPEFIERVDFYPGGFPVLYGGFTGGIVDGVTRPARLDERRFDIDLNLVQTGVFLRQPIPSLGMTATVAGRYGYPGLLLSLVTPEISLAYWDYQARLDGRKGRHAWTLFAYGAKDELKEHPKVRAGSDDPQFETQSAPPQESVTVARFHFHRLDTRYRIGGDSRFGLYRMVLGFDETLFGADGFSTEAFVVNPQARWQVPLSEDLRLHFGAEGTLRDIRTRIPEQEQDGTGFLQKSGVMGIGGGFIEGPWRVREELMLIPGVRADVYRHRGVTESNVDPRMMARYRLSDAPVGGTWLKGMLGWFHQPPRMSIALPGVDQSELSRGLLSSVQSSIGAEVRLAPGVELDVQTYFNRMDPILFDLRVNRSPDDVAQRPPSVPPGEMPDQYVPGDPSGGILDGLYNPIRGRSYGLEVMLRKRDTQGFFGWIAYTLSRSQRALDNRWADFDFDRRHILNMVAGVHLPRNWEIGGRVLYQTGTPVTTVHGYNFDRTAHQTRVDLRIDKRAVWNSWLLDFYVDIINVTVSPESGGLLGPDTFRYLIPTVGFRAVL